ncbi:MAG TPA: nucleotidyltransferase domain-containing protein [Candidatus Polarisedimenticolaceae bacterium]|nr:nucleotidyltransferase domain-containing protein [Candidatus Polarisedimenticolaceae bacterium]
MFGKDPREHPHLAAMVGALARAAGDRLESVVLYGSAARGEYHPETSDLNLLVVLRDLEPSTLELLSAPFARWEREGQPPPRLFSAELIAQASDVFPLELLDLSGFHVVLHGNDPLAGVEIRRDWLRLQCERELREKLMRLREGYVACHGRPAELTQLITTSYTTFVALFRGCLYLLGAPAPRRNAEAVAAFCERAGLDASAFDAVERLKRGERLADEPRTVFSRYYAELTRACRAVDRFEAR